MRKLFLLLLVLFAIAPLDAEEPCLQIHGRAVLHRGDGFFAIWQAGTHHIFSPANKQSVDFVCRFFDCESGDRQPALFADFTICPTAPFQQDAAQPVIVKAVTHPRVVAMWPPPKSPREFLDSFYEWYGKRVSHEAPDGTTLRLMRWDLSPELWQRLTEDEKAQQACNEIVGLDFDPIVGGQDWAESYAAGKITGLSDRYQAEIYGTTQGVRSSKPDVLAEFVHQGDRWFFVNFRYPSSKADLLTLLRKQRPACTVPQTPQSPRK